MTTKLFVYGSLKPGHSRWPILEAHVEPGAPVVDDVVEGRLWGTPWGWPALTAGSQTVRGVVVELRNDRVHAALDELDAVEGVGIGLFERVEAVTSSGVSCWVYVWPNPTDGFDPLHEVWRGTLPPLALEDGGVDGRDDEGLSDDDRKWYPIYLHWIERAAGHSGGEMDWDDFLAEFGDDDEDE